jgi:hypothetical protein
MREYAEGTGKTPAGSDARDSGEATLVLQGHIGGLDEDMVVIVPQLHDPYAIEVRRRDVLDFQAGCPSGRCRFVVRASAPIHERWTAMTRRSGVAAGVTGAGRAPAPDQRSRRPASRTKSASSPREPMLSFL